MVRLLGGADLHLEESGGTGVFQEEPSDAAFGLAVAAQGGLGGIEVRLEFVEGRFEPLALLFPDGVFFFDPARRTAQHVGFQPSAI